jgi:methyl-accepting chemotaxis protein/hemerythrin
MNYLEFKEEDSVKVKTIDDQHNKIAELVNVIHELILSGDKIPIVKALRELLEILEIHFETEERLMKETKFPGYISHKLEHDRFYNQVLKATDNYQKGIGNVGLEQLNGIKRWFFNHIEINDKKCGQYLADMGIN